MLRQLSSVLALATLASQVCAVEALVLDSGDPFVEVRLGLGLMAIPSAYTSTVAYTSPAPPPDDSLTETYSSTRAGAIGFGIVGGWLDPIGLVLGSELVMGMGSSSIIGRSGTIAPAVPIPAEPVETQWRTIGPNLLAGVGYAPTSYLHFEILGVLGGGALRRQQPNLSAVTSQTSTGWYWDAGVRGGAYVQLGSFVLGGCVEASYIRTHDSSNWNNAALTTEGKDFGVGGRFEISYRIQ